MMVDGTMFNGPAELRRALLERGDAFLGAITEQLMAYASGGTRAVNQLTPSSRMPAVRAALREAEAQKVFLVLAHRRYREGSIEPAITFCFAGLRGKGRFSTPSW
jgi:hypothetical protein